MKDILVETSARHVHVTQETLEALFGKGAQLEVRAMLSQPGQFVSNQRVDLVGYKVNKVTSEKTETRIKGVSILGPCRKANQVELAATDARTLGVKAVIRESGNTAGTPGCKLVGPAGEVEIPEGVIVAKRHIHMTPADAEEFGVTNGEIVKLEVGTPERSLIFGDVVVRVRDDFALACHIDTDESNACNGAGVVYGKIVK
ncbi:MAG: phosphate propanoyltransferase [Bacilli bacterium]|nr:phosphate propanoyltransferase [Bacilli bacterium]